MSAETLAQMFERLAVPEFIRDELERSIAAQVLALAKPTIAEASRDAHREAARIVRDCAAQGLGLQSAARNLDLEADDWEALRVEWTPASETRGGTDG